MLELSLHILDIVENSTRAGAKTVNINVFEDQQRDLLKIEIKDDGAGMSEETLKKVLDPFFTTKTVRRVGLGLPILAQAAESTEGKFNIESKGGEGTRVVAEFRLSHIDRQPMGDIAGTLVSLIAGNTDVDFIYRHECNERVFVLDTREIKKEIDDIPINQVDVLNFIRQLVSDGLNEIETKA